MLSHGYFLPRLFLFFYFLSVEPVDPEHLQSFNVKKLPIVAFLLAYEVVWRVSMSPSAMRSTLEARSSSQISFQKAWGSAANQGAEPKWGS